MKKPRTKIAVLIADQLPIVREGLKHIINRLPDIVISAEAQTGQEVLDIVDRVSIDVVVLDLSLPGKDGFEVLREVKRRKPDLRVLVLSIHSENQVGLRVLQIGASGFINKSAAPSEIINAIRRIHAGRTYLSPSLAQRLALSVVGGSSANPHEVLSNREFQVFLRIASGQSAHQAAQQMSISVKTVRTHRQRVLQKFKLTNDVELALYAIRNGLLGRFKEKTSVSAKI